MIESMVGNEGQDKKYQTGKIIIIRKVKQELKIKSNIQKRMQQKQKLLRQQILEKGYDPAKFYEYWQTLGMEFQNIEFEQLKIIVETYVQTYLEHRKNLQQNEEDQFDDFQQPSQSENNTYLTNQHEPVPNDLYADFDWDLLMGKTSEKKQSPNSIKPQIKKLPKIFDHKSSKNDQSSKPLKQTKNQKKQQLVLPQKSIHANKQVDLMQNEFDISLVDSIPKMAPQKIPENIPSNQKSFTITFKQLESQSTKQKIKCLKLQENILNHHKNVQINILNAQQLHQDSSLINKLWKGSQYLYTIKTIGRNKNRAVGVSWQVKRKYSDFQWLKNTLLKFYPGVVVPPLPPFPKSKDKLPGQTKKLQNLLMDAYRCPQLRNSKYFQVFLSYGNFSDFEGFKKSTETVTKPRELPNVLNMKGELQLLYGSSIEFFSAGMQQYLNKSSQHLKTVKSILTEIKDSYDNISGCYTKLSEVFQLMSKESCEFSEEKCFPKLTQTYKLIASLISKHSQFCIQEKSNIETFMMSHFSYEKDRIDNMQNLINRRNQFALELGKRQPKQETGGMFGKITGGVASLFGEKTESLEIPSSNYEKLYKQVGFYNSQLLNEMVRCVQVMIESQIDHFSGYGISRIDSVDKLQKTWSQIMVDLSKLNVM